MATMKPDGTLILQLRAEADDGTEGDALLVYRPGDAEYAKVLSHLGGMSPGDQKPVPPWPETPAPTAP